MPSWQILPFYAKISLGATNMPVMTTMNVSLPEPLKSFVEERVEGGGYQTASEYVRDLIRQDQEKQRTAQGKLEAMLLEGIESLQNGEGIEATTEMWNDIKIRFRARHGRDLGASVRDSGASVHE
jgi:antitoxin ParD1/3/4